MEYSRAQQWIGNESNENVDGNRVNEFNNVTV